MGFPFKRLRADDSCRHKFGWEEGRMNPNNQDGFRATGLALHVAEEPLL
jgi:hypothetical protein